jgi:hypothetical protein
MPALPEHAMRLRIVAGALTVAVVWCAVSGCGQQKRWPKPTERATAVVRLDGKPLADALVLLGPSGSGYAAQGTTDATGRATLTTFAPGDGAVAGRYRVMVSCEEVKPNPAVVLPDPKVDLEGFRKAMEAAVNAGLPTHLRRQLLPARYVSCDTSGLTAEIEPGRENVLRFELSSAAEPAQR